jgi:hypothetical protein
LRRSSLNDDFDYTGRKNKYPAKGMNADCLKFSVAGEAQNSGGMRKMLTRSPATINLPQKQNTLR